MNDLQVIKRDYRLELFNEDKLVRCISKVVADTYDEDIAKFVDTDLIVASVYARLPRDRVSSITIQTVLEDVLSFFDLHAVGIALATYRFKQDLDSPPTDQFFYVKFTNGEDHAMYESDLVKIISNIAVDYPGIDTELVCEYLFEDVYSGMTCGKLYELIEGISLGLVSKHSDYNGLLNFFQKLDCSSYSSLTN